MAKYGSVIYGGAKYGESPQLAYSVDPMSILVVDFTRIFLTWKSPTGDFSRIRLVRNQVGYPEHAEDGVIIWDEFAESGSVSRNSYFDGQENPEATPVSSGRQVYYRMFLFTSAKVWVNAGQISAVIPFNHESQKKFMDFIPKVYTSDVHSPLGVIDQNSDLYKFVEGMTFTYDGFLTQLELLRPQKSSEKMAEAVVRETFKSYGLQEEPGIPLKNQKRLIREAMYMYTHRGLKNGLDTYAEALTGYAPTTVVSPNLLLSIQDSSFYKTTGNWQFTNTTGTSTTEMVPVVTDYVVDDTYTCKVVVSAALGYMTLGLDDPIKKGIPVKADTLYWVSFKHKSPSSAGSVQLNVTWHDRNGEVLSSNTYGFYASNNSWNTVLTSFTSPADTVYATLRAEFSATGTYYLDQISVCEEDLANFDGLGNLIYEEARAVTVFLNPNVNNYIHNPSFENNTTDGWTLAGNATATIVNDVPDFSYSGIYSAEITATDAWTFTSNRVPDSSLDVGTYYTFSMNLKSDAPLTVTFLGVDQDGLLTGHQDSFSFAAQPEWVRVSATDLIGSIQEEGVDKYDIQISGEAGTFYIDCVQFEKSVKPTEYFDGSMPSDYGVVWEGDADNSVSHLYYGKPFKVPRLGATISGWLPPNCPWRITTYAGLEYKGITD